MLRPGLQINQKQTLQQKLSPLQIQYIKLLQLPTTAIEMRVKEELEVNPVLEEYSQSDLDQDYETDHDPRIGIESENEPGGDKSVTDPVDDNKEIDWDSILHNRDYEGSTYQSDNDDWRESNDPYSESFVERLEQQMTMLNLDNKQRLIAEEIIGSLDDDGYLRRDLGAISDRVAFEGGFSVSLDEVSQILNRIQKFDPPGIAARDLRECLLLQLERKPAKLPGRDIAIRILRDEWDLFEKKHFDKVMKRLAINDEELKQAYESILMLDPKPGLTGGEEIGSDYIVPDFEVYFKPSDENDDIGDFIIHLNRKNVPTLRVSPSYKKMWDELSQKRDTNESIKDTKSFIRTKIESAKAFMDALEQRKNTLMFVMKTIVALQESFFRNGSSLRPMILKDVADRIGMDISTVSRIVNGKYVQTPFGVFELKYFFNERVETQDGNAVANRDVKNLVDELIRAEDKSKPLSDDALASALQNLGFLVARRTVTKYREQLNHPVARLRKEV
jgi:RNA polymerase sigma-54 factor